MFFLWVRCGDKGKGYYLPQAQNWSGRLSLDKSITHAEKTLYLPVKASEGVFTLEPPQGFAWKDNVANGTLAHCTRITFVRKSIKLEVCVAEMDKRSTAMRKIAITQPTLTIGSKPENAIQYAQPPVSRNHAALAFRPDGSCQFTDQSSNGSFVNGEFFNNQTRPLRFGDTIVILPALQIVYLGSCLAVSSAEGVTLANYLRESSMPEMKNANIPDVSVVTEYHRSPRHLPMIQKEAISIEGPMEKERARELPAWLAVGPSFTMVLPMVVSSAVSGRNIGTSLAMVGTSAGLAVMWAMINRKYQGQQRSINEETRQRICTQYYAEMEERLAALTQREQKRMLFNYPGVEECVQLPSSGSARLWERQPSHRDFLDIRLGLGEAPLPVEINFKPPQMAMMDDPLRHEPQRIYDKYNRMENVPVICNLRQNAIVGVLGQKQMPWLMQSMVIQAAANHSYNDVRIVILHDDEDAAQWSFARWLPHVYSSADRNLRMVVSSENAIAEVLGHVDNVLSMRAELRGERQNEEEEANINSLLPWYLIFCTDPKVLENHSIARYLQMTGLGFSLIIQTANMGLLPKECQCVIEAKEQLGAVYHIDGGMTGVRFEPANDDMTERFSRSIAQLRIKETVENTNIPSLVTFLETYQARRTDDLDLLYFWSENHAWRSIKSCLGYKAGSVPFYLDISDKNHGPHGLIAGTTGAGKSVLLQTFILSLAINYSPTEVQFILIDYKGGGTSEDFRKLPHAAGIIDSLQGERMIFRALASIKGEILRREEIFKNVGVNNIDDYMKLFNNDPAEEPLGHLIIIVDEFAELKQERPEFMHELVSAARVGRSLGMHLVLATQKPSNSVSDEIAANTRFRICLRVASKSDSSEMLKRPDAAFLKGMGRCYVQVGNDELFEQVQTSYTGATYNPEALRMDEAPRMLGDAGQHIRFKRKKAAVAENEKPLTELDAVLARLNEACEQYHFAPAKALWLPEIKDILMLSDIEPMKERGFDGKSWQGQPEEETLAYYALADDIEKQRYLPVAMDFLAEKNQLICGLPTSGKTTLLQTLAVSLALRYTPEEVNIYAFSLTSRTLACLKDLPHVGDIVFEEDIDEQVRLMELIYAECERRKKLFAMKLTDNYIQYNRAAQADGEDKVPVVVVLIDRIAQLVDWGNRRLDDKLQLFYDMLRSSSSLGVYFVMTAYARSELPSKYHAFVHGLTLQMNERGDYADALGARVPTDWGGIRENPGRGMIAVVDKEAKRTYLYEIQAALYGTSESDSSRAQMVVALGQAMTAAWKGAAPRGIPRIPKDPVLSDLLTLPEIAPALKSRETIPLFYDKNKGEAVSPSLRDCFSMLILGAAKSGKTSMLKNIAHTFTFKESQIHVIGNQDLSFWAKKRGMSGYTYGDQAWTEAFSAIFKEIGSRSSLLAAAAKSGGAAARSALLATFTPIVILIDDLEKYIAANESKPVNLPLNAQLKFFCEANVSGYGIYVYATVSHSGYASARIKEPMVTMVAGKRGIMLQGRLNECDPFSAPVPYNKKSLVYPVGEALYLCEGELRHVVIPKWTE